MRINQPPFPGGLVQNVSQILSVSQSASASVNINLTNLFGRQAMVYFTIHSLPGSASTTLALKVRSVDPFSGLFTPVANMVARSATGTLAMSISPYISSASVGGVQNVQASLPRDLNILISQSSGATSKDVVFSIGMAFMP